MKFSVTIPAYKSIFLAEAIESVLQQTYSDFELIIVNDHSPENLDDIVAKYHDERIRYFVNEKNCGAERVVDNWNICLSYAKGEYIICMGDDDRLLPCCLAEYAKLIEKHPHLAVYHGWTEIINEKSELVEMQEARPEYEGIYSAMNGRWCNNRLNFIGDYLFHTDTLRKDGGFFFLPLAWGSDDISGFVAASHCGIANTQVPVFQYRATRHSLSCSNNSIFKINSIYNYHKRCEELLLSNEGKNKIEECFRKELIKKISHHRTKKYIYEMKIDMMGHGICSGILKWKKLQAKYHFSSKMIFYAAIEAIKSKFWASENKHIEG